MAPARCLYAAGCDRGAYAVNIARRASRKVDPELLTVAKVLGLAGSWPSGFRRLPPLPAVAAADGWRAAIFGFAMIFILYAYGGWNEMAYVAAEVRNPGQEHFPALDLGTLW